MTDSATAQYLQGVLTKDEPSELDRLRLLEQVYDPHSRRAIEATGLRPDWRVLELGAGAGSVAHWLHQRLAPGHLTVVDIDTRYLTDLRARGVQVIEDDITHVAASLTATFDLVHARAVLMHAGDPESMLDTVLTLLRPGGWLVIEDPYFLPAQHGPHAAWRRANEAWHSALVRQGVDLAWPRRTATAMAARGVTEIGVHVQPGGLGAGALHDELLAVRLRQGAPRLIDAGLLTEADVEDAAAVLAAAPAPDLSTFMYTTVGRLGADREALR